MVTQPRRATKWIELQHHYYGAERSVTTSAGQISDRQ